MADTRPLSDSRDTQNRRKRKIDTLVDLEATHPIKRARIDRSPIEISSDNDDSPSFSDDDSSLSSLDDSIPSGEDTTEPVSSKQYETDESNNGISSEPYIYGLPKGTRTQIPFDNPKDFPLQYVDDLGKAIITELWLNMVDDTVTHVSAHLEGALFSEMIIDDPALVYAFGCKQLPTRGANPKLRIFVPDFLNPYDRFCLVYSESEGAQIGVLKVLQGVYQTFMSLRKARHPLTPATGREARIIAKQHGRPHQEVLSELHSRWDREQNKTRFGH
ncbi:hypothetical protein K491DRAFT_675161 [Lophiostoma macrostomum CBS 122681]|uniref:Uncharacterized protein n=1 Tax=Lophiostoma macrostomum CBS 122681 TaxID=1314788 RepID=A0A6A6TMQ4_9PLEO|nr:hypothetical protein K491DRAFT_675161 [Lophiostoma macrostomum CBS 122681]